MRKRAVDTNVLVRILVDDGSEQSASAQRLLSEDHTLLVGSTVLLETEWVLRSRYRLSGRQINGLLSQLPGLPVIEIAQREAVRKFLLSHRDGVDFADALHFHLAIDCDDFLTFDLDFIRKAKREGVLPLALHP